MTTEEKSIELEIKQLQYKLDKIRHSPNTREELIGAWSGPSKGYFMYYYPHSSGKVMSGSDKDDYWIGCLNNNNSFSCEEDAKRAGKRRELEAMLWSNSYEFIEGAANWYIRLNVRNNKLDIGYSRYVRLAVPYFTYRKAEAILRNYRDGLIDLFI
jgi:hypothetical protein